MSKRLLPKITTNFWKNLLFFSLSLLMFPYAGHASPDRAQLSVWINEAIIATYTLNYKTYLEQQKENAKYFTSNGWIAYSKALDAAKLPLSIQQNAYDVSAVATSPPKIITLGPTQWQATMPILVVYENPQYQQKQDLQVTINFTQAANGQGVRGFSITSLQSKVITPPCQCPIQKQSTSNQNSPEQPLK